MSIAERIPKTQNIKTIGTDDDVENMIYTKDENDLDKEAWMEHLTRIFAHRPNGNAYVESDRGIEIARLVLETEKKIHIWRWSDPETFWVDVQLFTKYGLDDKDVVFCVTHQPGYENYKKYAEERHAYSKKLRAEFKESNKNAEEQSSIYDAGETSGSGRERTGVEVFTPKWVVRMMCDMLEKESPEAFQIEKTFLEPTCGEGAFVLEVLERKFERCKNKNDYLTAIQSVYGMDIEADNVAATIRNVIALCEEHFKVTKQDIEIIKDHYIMCDSLKIMRLLVKDDNLTIVDNSLSKGL